MLEREDVRGVWRDYTEHNFVNRLGDGTLPVENFQYYLVQDYLFLVSIILLVTAIRMLTASRYNLHEQMRWLLTSPGPWPVLVEWVPPSTLWHSLTVYQMARQVLHIQKETELHLGFCRDYGLEAADIESQEEDQGMISIQCDGLC
jgi:thiaminase